MGISTGVLPDHHKNLYAIVRDRKLYYRMHTVGLFSFLRISLVTCLSRHHPFLFSLVSSLLSLSRSHSLSFASLLLKRYNDRTKELRQQTMVALLNFPGVWESSRKRPGQSVENKKKENVSKLEIVTGNCYFFQTCCVNIDELS